MDAGVRFRTMNTRLANGHRGHPFTPLCAPRKGFGNGRKIITKCNEAMEINTTLQVAELKPCNVHSQACTHTHQIMYLR